MIVIEVVSKTIAKSYFTEIGSKYTKESNMELFHAEISPLIETWTIVFPLSCYRPFLYISHVSL